MVKQPITQEESPWWNIRKFGFHRPFGGLHLWIVLCILRYEQIHWYPKRYTNIHIRFYTRMYLNPLEVTGWPSWGSHEKAASGLRHLSHEEGGKPRYIMNHVVSSSRKQWIIGMTSTMEEGWSWSLIWRSLPKSKIVSLFDGMCLRSVFKWKLPRRR